MKSGKRAVFICVGILMILFMSWLIFSGLQPPVLPVGSPLPKLGIETCAGLDTLRCTPGRPVLVMLFSTRCPHCVYQLELFEKRLLDLASFRVFLLTLERDFRLCEDILRWRRLAAAESVTWGWVNGSEFISQFGNGISPSSFVFDIDGHLVYKIRGEVKLTKILASM